MEHRESGTGAHRHIHTYTHIHTLTLAHNTRTRTDTLGRRFDAESREDFAQDLFSRLELIEGRG